MLEPIQNIGSSTLIGKTCRKVGFAWMKSPLDHKDFVEFVFYELEPDLIVLCVSQGLGKYDQENSRKGLGGDVTGEMLVPWARRLIQGKVDWSDFEKTLKNAYPDIEFEWEKPNA